jgi:hypothetical protein
MPPQPANHEAHKRVIAVNRVRWMLRNQHRHCGRTCFDTAAAFAVALRIPVVLDMCEQLLQKMRP